MEGEFDEARAMIARARRDMVERWRLRRPLMWAARSSAAVETLSRVLSMQDRSSEADGFATMSVDYSPAEGAAAQPLWRAARALVMVSRDRHSEAERLAREAVGLAPAEMPNLRADLLMDLAGVLLSAGQRARAQPVIAEAVERYDRKGNLVSAARARSFGD
jgi:hypothetical protein